MSNPYNPGRPSKYNPMSGKGTTPPHKAGEYRIRDAGGNMSYVGETCDLNRRMSEHLRSGKLSKDGSTFEFQVADGRSTSRTRRIHEQEKIEQHRPSLNRSIGGEGRIAKH